MIDQDIYFAPVKKVRVRFTLSGSRFIATLIPTAREEKAREAISAVSGEFPDATHHAYAYRIGYAGRLIERAFDDREPAGTAGAPMLQYLGGNNISDVLVIATRYFGGTKLGVGGLIRAYRDCARFSVEDARLVSREPLDSIILQLSYEDLGVVKRLLENHEGSNISLEYGEKVDIKADLPTRLTEQFLAAFQSACRGRCSWKYG